MLVRFDLSLSKLRGQCYNGASNVSGKISGLQQRIRKEEPRALFVRCNAHNLNLVVQDGIEKVLSARKFIGEVKDLINFVLDSPKRVAKFQELKKTLPPLQRTAQQGKIIQNLTYLHSNDYLSIIVSLF